MYNLLYATLKMNESEKKVLDVFFDNPTGEFYIREIARLTGLNPNTVINVTEKLLKDNLIKKDKKRHVVELSASINEKFKTKKRVRNLEKLYDSGLIDLLSSFYKPESIVVLGSYSSGEDILNSDVDLFIVSKKEGTADIRKFEKMLKRKIHILVSDYSKISEEFYTNLINGIVLYGSIRGR